jgi:hypothetical protein
MIRQIMIINKNLLNKFLLVSLLSYMLLELILKIFCKLKGALYTIGQYKKHCQNFYKKNLYKF